MEEFETIKDARVILAAIPKSTASEETKAGYHRTMQRLCANVKSGTDILANASNTQKISTWFSRRAAIVHTTRDLIERLMKAQDATQRELRGAAQDDPRWHEWRATVREIKRWTLFLRQAYKAPAIAKADRVARHSKRKELRGLPDDWRERIVERMPKYREAVLVAAVTGCRPSELVTGVHIVVDGPMMTVTIKGAKTTAKTGQPWRKLWWPIDSESPLVKALFDLAFEKQVYEGLEVRIDDAKAFSGAVRAAGMREWSGRKSSITPYCFRHQATSDMKASGTLSDEDVSAALGHCSDDTKTTYGHRGMSSGRSVCPVRVEAARPVRKVPQSKAAKARRTVSATPASLGKRGI